VRQPGIDQPDRAHQRQLIGGVPSLERSGLKRTRRRPSCVNNEYVEAPELGHHRVDQRSWVATLGQIRRAPPHRPHRLSGSLDRRSVARCDKHLCALRGQRLSASAPEPLAGRSYERTTPIEAEIHAHNCGVLRTINVAAIPNANGWTVTVRIDERGRMVSEHAVTVTTADKERFAPHSTVEDLVTRSFEFLLERESSSSILRTFALPDIERYFPDYPAIIAK
jgi:hypothetical protein